MSTTDDKVIQPDMVNHPDHYGGDTPYEVIKVIRAWGLGFDLGNAVKYIARAGKKDPAKHVEDLEKAVFYLEDEIKHIRAEMARLERQERMAQEFRRPPA